MKEKGGRQHAMPCRHKLEEHLDAYVTAAGIHDQKSGPLFRSARGRTGRLTENRFRRGNAYDAIRRRARQAGIATEICPHTFRATGITNYLTNSGSLEIAQQMAAHADARTTKLYDRRNEQVRLMRLNASRFRFAYVSNSSSSLVRGGWPFPRPRRTRSWSSTTTNSPR